MYFAPISTNAAGAVIAGSAIWAFRVPHAALKNIHLRYIDVSLSGLPAAALLTGVELIRLTATGAPSGGTGVVPVKGWESHPTSILTTSDIKFSSVALGGLGGGAFNSNSFGNLLANVGGAATLSATTSTRLRLDFDKVGDGSMVFRPSGLSTIASEGLAIRVIAADFTAGITVSGSVGWDEDSI